VAQHNVTRSADPDGSTREALDELQVDLGGRIPHRWMPAATGRLSTLDLLGPGFTLFTGEEGMTRESAGLPSGPVPLAVRRLDPIAARALGIPDGGALVVRPDGRVHDWHRVRVATRRRRSALRTRQGEREGLEQGLERVHGLGRPFTSADPLR
jgi:hypothetical protein